MLVPRVERFANHYSRCGYRFVPLIGDTFGPENATACALDILFLRRDAPGRLVKSGDIDNRMKVLFDALRMPHNRDEVGSSTPTADENPFYCLMVDDSLITEVKVTTDRLLTTPTGSATMDDVHLIIHVRTLHSGADRDPKTAFMS